MNMLAPARPRVTFGMIVLNGMPFVPYNLRSLYPFAHQIIVVEGAVPRFAHAATGDGHSIDGTLDELRRFKSKEDPEGKVIVVTAEDEDHPNGFWPGEKLEMSQAYAKRATGDWLWQVDCDEFYTESDMEIIFSVLSEQPEVNAISFHQITFWGSLEWYVDGPFMRGHMVGGECHRLFRWKPGWKYVSHAPPTVCDDRGRDLRSSKWLNREYFDSRGIAMKHYSLLFREQVAAKCRYYDQRGDMGITDSADWAERNWLKLSAPFHVHNTNLYVAWLERYRGEHPKQITLMWNDILEGRINFSLRPMHDVAELMRSPLFCFLRLIMRRWPAPEAMSCRGAYRLEKTLEVLAAWYDRRWERRHRQQM